MESYCLICKKNTANGNSSVKKKKLNKEINNQSRKILQTEIQASKKKKKLNKEINNQSRLMLLSNCFLWQEKIMFY